MPPWAPTFAFDLKVDDGSGRVPSPQPSEPAAAAASAQKPCCRGVGGSASAADSGSQQQLLAEALLLAHPELCVSGVKVNHAHHRVEVLAAPAATQQVRNFSSSHR